MHFNTCMYFTIVIAVIMFVFSSPTGSPGHPDLDQTYPSLSDDLREDALHDLLERIDIHEGLVSTNPWSGRETELRQQHTQSFIVLKYRHSNRPLKWNQMLLNKVFNMKAVMSVLIQLPKSVVLGITLNLEVAVPVPMILMILMEWYIPLSIF